MTDPSASDQTLPAGGLLRPEMPHDHLTFEELAAAYNFRNTSDRRKIFARLIVDEIEARERPVRVLDIGCGSGFGTETQYTREMATRIDEFWGIEPDASVTPEPGIFGHFQHALMETAELPEDAFDVAYAYMVLEHVAEPHSFLAAVHRCLKPGGVFMFITPNARHYFTRSAALLHALKIDEIALRAIKGKSAEEYHYPVQYKMNTEKRLNQIAARTGFDPPEFAYMERRGPESYMPGPLRPAFRVLAWKRKVLPNPKNLLTLIGRMRKPVRRQE